MTEQILDTYMRNMGRKPAGLGGTGQVGATKMIRYVVEKWGRRRGQGPELWREMEWKTETGQQ